MASNPINPLRQPIVLRECLGVSWPRQMVSLPVRFEPGDVTDTVVTLQSDIGQLSYGQITGSTMHPDGSLESGILHFFSDLPAWSERRFTLSESAAPPSAASPVFEMQGSGSVVLGNSMLKCRHLLGPYADSHGDAVLFELTVSPECRLLGTARVPGLRVKNGTAVLLEAGPLLARTQLEWEFTGGGRYRLTLEMHQRSDVLLIHEEFEGWPEEDERRMVIEIESEFAPESVFWRAHSPHRKRGKGGGRGYEIDYSETDAILMRPLWPWYADCSHLWSGCPKASHGQCISLAMIHPSRWRNGHWVPIEIVTEPGPKMSVRGVLTHGARDWLFAVHPEDAVYPAPSFLPPSFVGKDAVPEITHPAEALMAEYGGPNLSTIASMDLTWPGAMEAAHPRLLIRPEEVGECRERFKRWEWMWKTFLEHNDDPENSDHSGTYILNGDMERARAAKARIVEYLWRTLVEACRFGYHYPSLVAISLTRPLRTTAIDYDFVAQSGAFAEEEREWCLAAFAFMAEMMSEPDSWPPTSCKVSKGNVNFHSDHYTCLGVLACLLEGHPRRKEWMEYLLREMKDEFQRNVSETGAWVEAPNYQGFSMCYFTVAATIFKNCGFEDFFKNANFKSTMRYMERLQTPVDPRAEVRLQPTLGDTTAYYHSQSLQVVFAWVAKAVARDDPEFSAEMMRAWRNAGAMPIGHHDLGNCTWKYTFALINNELPSAGKADFASEWLKDVGVLFRRRHNEADESYLFFKQGRFDQHFDHDEGTILWYAKGVPLLLDYGSMYMPCVDQAWMHNRVSLFPTSDYTRGEVTAFKDGERAAYAEGFREIEFGEVFPLWPDRDGKFNARFTPITTFNPPVKWRRRLLYIKEPECLLIRDELESGYPTEWNLHVLAEEMSASDGHAFFRGQHGVDLHAWWSEPENAQVEHLEWEHQGMAEKHDGRMPDLQWTSPSPVRQMAEQSRILRMHGQAGQGYFALLFPVRPGECEPRVESVEGGFVLRRGTSELVVVLSPEPVVVKRAGLFLRTARGYAFRDEANGEWTRDTFD